MDTVNFTRPGPVDLKIAPSSSRGAAGGTDFQPAKPAEDKTAAATPLAASALLPYASPVIASDTTTGALVLSFRDQATGESLYQYPSKTALQYQAAQSRPTGVTPAGSDETG